MLTALLSCGIAGDECDHVHHAENPQTQKDGSGMNVMEPRLMMYRVIMALGLISFLFSFNAHYFPTTFVCILSAIFTAVYLWEELMCSEPPREVPPYTEIGALEQFEPVVHYRKNPEMTKVGLFFDFAVYRLAYHVIRNRVCRA